MVVYRRTSSTWLKWVLFVIVFILGMTVTFDDVYGFGVDNGRKRTDVRQDQPKHNHDWSYDKPGDNENENPPAAVPEPTTLLLMGAGLGAVYIAKRRGAKK
ncbi:PEP-CTERM sorting domain-containing protein [bacterium]|nr:PEP-CTERM sorting domain-containing protein [bacterium]